MIARTPWGARVWLAGGITDMRKGMPGLALLVRGKGWGWGGTRTPATSTSSAAGAVRW